MTDPDIDVDRMTTDELADYVNRVGPIASALPDGEYAEPILTANAEAAVAELKERNGLATDGGDHLTGDDRDPSDAEVAFGETVDDFEGAVTDALTDGGDELDAAIDDEVGTGAYYLRDVEPEDYDVKIRHDGHVETDVVDGYIVHRLTESYDRDADGDSLSLSSPTCPLHNTGTHRDRERDDVDDDQYIDRFTCDGDDGACPFEASVGRVRAEYDDPDNDRPLWLRVTESHDVDAIDFDEERYETLVDAANHDSKDDRVGVANVLRRLSLTNDGNLYDDAYVKSEFDDDGDKTADAYIDTFDCGNCGDTHDVGAERSHPHFGDVCRACEDVAVWSIDDADLPDDVADEVDRLKSVTPTKLRTLLRDVAHWREYVAAAKNDAADSGGMFTGSAIDSDDVTPDDVPACPTGKQGERRISGHGKPGTGLRRPDGAAHGDAQWRTVVKTARDTGLITRVDDEDVDFDAPGARWETTEKGDAVLSEIARCEWCGGELRPAMWSHTYKVSRWSSSTDRDLIMQCADTCRDDRVATRLAD